MQRVFGIELTRRRKGKFSGGETKVCWFQWKSFAWLGLELEWSKAWQFTIQSQLLNDHSSRYLAKRRRLTPRSGPDWIDTSQKCAPPCLSSPCAHAANSISVFKHQSQSLIPSLIKLISSENEMYSKWWAHVIFFFFFRPFFAFHLQFIMKHKDGRFQGRRRRARNKTYINFLLNQPDVISSILSSTTRVWKLTRTKRV